MTLRVLVPVMGLAALMLGGCGQQPSPSEPTPEPAPESTPAPTPSADTPAPTSAQIPPPEPSPAPQPKLLYVTTEFRAVSQLGTHEFPVGTEVELLEIEGEEYLVQKGDVAVRIHRTYFSEIPPAPPATPIAEATPEPTPDEISLTPAPPAPEVGQQSTPSPVLEPTPVALTTPETTGPLSPEEQRISELTDSIREVDNQLREARQSGATGEVEKLRKKRDALSEELTSYGKP